MSLVPAGALASSVSSLVRHMSRGVSQGLQSGLPALDSLQGSLSGLSKPAKPGHKQSPPSPALTVNRYCAVLLCAVPCTCGDLKCSAQG